MKVIKKINNNVVICQDNKGIELVAFGKGIGFPQVPYELTDLKKIDRTFYNISKRHLDSIYQIPEMLFDISAKIVDYAIKVLRTDMNPNLIFTLADHIQFTIQRYEKQMHIQYPFLFDLKHLYEKEMDIGEKSISYINRVMKIHLSQEEAVGIALHIINSQNIKEHNKTVDEMELIDDITEIIEHSLNIHIDKNGFNYSRFVTHIQYLLKRQKTSTNIVSANIKIMETLKKEYTETYQCSLEIRQYIESKLHFTLIDEELLYLMLHINRLQSREDCNQSGMTSI